MKIKLGVSPCLLGEKVRYDGGHRLDPFITETIGSHVDFVAVCPEVGCGLPVPREPMRLEGGLESVRLVTVNTRMDHTERMLDWTLRLLAALEREGLRGFIFKSGSPSCGVSGVGVYGEDGSLKKTASGLFAGAFMERFPLIPVFDEVMLSDPVVREQLTRYVLNL